MSTAILISGQARTIAQCVASQYWHVYRHFPDLHFFIVWQKDANAVAGVKLLEDKYGKDRVHAKLIDDPKDLPMIPLKLGAHAPYANAAPHPQLLMQHWYQNEVWKLYLESGPRSADEIIIRMRGDNFFHSCEKLPAEATSDGVCYTPWWGRFGGVNDRFAVMDRKGAEAYFTVYPCIQGLLEQGCPFHPESLTLAALLARGVESFDKLRAEFSTMRTPGDMRGPMRFMETTAADIAHFAASR